MQVMIRGLTYQARIQFFCLDMKRSFRFIFSQTSHSVVSHQLPYECSLRTLWQWRISSPQRGRKKHEWNSVFALPWIRAGFVVRVSLFHVVLVCYILLSSRNSLSDVCRRQQPFVSCCQMRTNFPYDTFVTHLDNRMLNISEKDGKVVCKCEAWSASQFVGKMWHVLFNIIMLFLRIRCSLAGTLLSTINNEQFESTSTMTRHQAKSQLAFVPT